MYIYEYYIIIYEELQKYEQYLKNYLEQKDKTSFNEKFQDPNQKVAENKFEKSNNFTKETSNKLDADIKNDVSKEDTTCDSNDIINYMSNNKESNNIKTNTNTNIKSNNSTWIRKIYTKLIFLFHPDKKILVDDIAFSKIKSDYENNDYSSILYYFTKEKNHYYLSRLFNEMSHNQKFLDSLLNLSKFLKYKINLILDNQDFVKYLKTNNLFN
jgi:hypothetical protein